MTSWLFCLFILLLFYESNRRWIFNSSKLAPQNRTICWCFANSADIIGNRESRNRISGSWVSPDKRRSNCGHYRRITWPWPRRRVLRDRSDQRRGCFYAWHDGSPPGIQPTSPPLNNTQQIIDIARHRRAFVCCQNWINCYLARLVSNICRTRANNPLKKSWARREAIFANSTQWLNKAATVVHSFFYE